MSSSLRYFREGILLILQGVELLEQNEMKNEKDTYENDAEEQSTVIENTECVKEQLYGALTKDIMREIFVGKCRAGKAEDIRKILCEYDVVRLSDLPEEVYEEVYKRVIEL